MTLHTLLFELSPGGARTSVACRLARIRNMGIPGWERVGVGRGVDVTGVRAIGWDVCLRTWGQVL